MGLLCRNTNTLKARERIQESRTNSSLRTPEPPYTVGFAQSRHLKMVTEFIEFTCTWYQKAKEEMRGFFILSKIIQMLAILDGTGFPGLWGAGSSGIPACTRCSSTRRAHGLARAAFGSRIKRTDIYKLSLEVQTLLVYVFQNDNVNSSMERKQHNRNEALFQLW